MDWPLRVLVLRDRESLGPASVFERRGDRVRRVGTLSAAVGHVLADAVDLVLVDLAEPGPAADACALLCEKTKGGVPIVALGAAEDGTETAAPGVYRVRDIEEAMPLVAGLAASAARARRLEPRTGEIDDLRRFTDELVSQLPTRLYVLDEEMRVLFANRPALRDSGIEPPESVGRPLADLLPAARPDGPVFSAIGGVLSGGGPTHLVGLHLPRAEGGGEHVVNVRVDPCALAGPNCVRLAIDDVTDEWLAELGRAREASKLDEVVGAMGAGLATLDSDLRITWTSRTFAQWFGESVGRRCPDVLGGAGCGGPDCPAVRALDSGTCEPETWQRHSPEGRRRTFHNSFALATERDGSRSVIVLVQDVSPQADRVEQMELLVELGHAIQGVRDLDELLHLILTCVTTGHALGFNRAFLFLRDRRTGALEGRMAVGPASGEEAHRVWADLSARVGTLGEALEEARKSGGAPPPLFDVIREVSYPLDSLRDLPVRVFREKRSALVEDASTDPRLTADFRKRFGAGELVAVPLVSKGRSLGVIVADNLYNGRPIGRDDLALLEMFAAPAGLAIENAEAFHDLTESLVTLRRTRQQLIDQTKLAAVGRAAAHIAHEIRNPLAAIGGFAHSIRRGPGRTERVRENAGIIYDEVLRLEKMVSGIMNFSRPARPALARQSLNAVVESALDMLTGRLPENVEISAALDPEAREVRIDAGQIRQVLTNLVRNAAESMPQGGHVLVRTRPEGGGAALVVEDDGPGVPSAHRERVFEPFFTTRKGGTGLGLAVCRQIVAEHGGEVSLESVEGEGAKFTVTFPPSAGQGGA